MNDTTALQATDDPSVHVPTKEPTSFMQMIENAVLDPRFDADKLEKLINANERVMDRQARLDFDAAKARASEKMKHIKIVKNRSVAYDVEKGNKSAGQKEAFKYAALEDIDKIITPILQEEKIDVSYKIEPCSIPAWHTIVCILSHAGHRESYPMPMPLDTSGGKGNAQAMGSTQMYGMRRALCGAFNIIPLGLDDDAAGGKIDDGQAKYIKELLQETGSDVKAFLKWVNAPCVEEIENSNYRKAVNQLEKKKTDGGKNAKNS